MTRDLAGDSSDTRPIHVNHVGGNQHIVHGVYGLVLANGIRPTHLTLTWTAARAYTVICTLTNPATGENLNWHLLRSLLRDGGKNGTVKIDPAGDITFLEISGTTRVAWIALNRRWLSAYISNIDQLVPPGHNPRH